MTLFDMFNKAAGLTEDAKKYNTGDISEKTGLQKQPDGSWKPPKAKGSQPKGTEKKAEATNGSAKPLTRTEATERVFQNHIKEFKDIKKQYSKLPRKELERVYSQKVSRTNSVETLPKGEIAEALTQHEMLNKYSGEIRDLLKKPENTNDSAPLTADTKIKLSQIKTTDDAKRYNIGDISEKTGLQKTANGWVRPKNQKTSGTEQKQEKNKNSSGKPSAELVAKRNARAEARKKTGKIHSSNKFY